MTPDEIRKAVEQAQVEHIEFEDGSEGLIFYAPLPPEAYENCPRCGNDHAAGECSGPPRAMKPELTKVYTAKEDPT